MNEDRFEQGMRPLNLEQREFVARVTQSVQNQMNGSEERIKMFLAGNEEQLSRCYQKRVVKKCALTGAVAKLTKRSTFHSLLKLPVQKDGKIVQMRMLTGMYLRQMRLDWRNVHFLFVDEISTVPYEMLCMIDSRLRQLKSKDDFFGGENIVLLVILCSFPLSMVIQFFDNLLTWSRLPICGDYSLWWNSLNTCGNKVAALLSTY
ncbi:hypothetical protein QAD02_013453 [Eretmocerus hayati]|uniref:Uncharacterized protein n=1 Tax=Eretmocerus hayati TaxID=131215 RepID=A0ACC2P4C2_9HYME|nr:hypothetical protein QAD02_013453 [Eretmocerus hayati]